MRIRTRMMRAVLAAGALAAVSLAPSTSHAANNMLTNGGFEQTPVPAQIAKGPMGLWNQPVIPTGWAFEGATELFDHAAHFPGPKHGQYYAQISGSWSGPRGDCSATCVSSPAPVNGARDTAYGYYSVQPAWRNLNPVGPISAGTSYTLSAWVRLDIPLDGTGAVARVRWVNAQGVPVGVSNAWTFTAPSAGTDTNRANYRTFAEQSVRTTAAQKNCQQDSSLCPFDDYSTVWTFKSGTVTAPAGATGAIVLLGYTDSAWIGGVLYDTACFSVAAGTQCVLTYTGN